MHILAIETSCDETAISLIEAKGGLRSPSFKIIKNLVASQIKIHQPFGGVVPNLAKREHLKNLPILFKKLVASGYTMNPNIIAVTIGPGLEPALWTGINFAQNLKSSILNFKSRIIGVNHLEGHLYSFLLTSKTQNLKPKTLFPAIALIVSGGHTILIKMDSLEKYKKIGETRDDAVGEAFDKVARLLGLSYPGGPEIERLAKKGNPDAINFPRPMLNQKNFDFSFSGLKTAVLYYLISVKKDKNFSVKGKFLADVSASFQKTAFDVLIKKTLRAAEKFNAQSIMISGGVASNKTLQKEFKKAIKNKLLTANCQLIITQFPTDNAAMIAAAGYINYLKKKNRRLVANGNLSI